MLKITPQLLQQAWKRGQCLGQWQQVNMVSNSLGVKSNCYEDAITTLNSLQSNAAYIREARKCKRSRSEEAWKLAFTKSYLELIGVTSADLSNLSVIHVAGTKGKGSTSAYCESILRQHGFRTGFFSSPHLVSVCERIRINGKPISTKLFTEYFWQVYNTICEKRSTELKMPSYFIFLTILAYKIFLKEMVDVAIIEVGIGGEFDSTNVLNHTSVVGITSLGLDHTALLGNTISDIAWQKAGILKPSAIGFTVAGHPPEAIKVLVERSQERKCPLKLAPPLEKYEWPDEATKKRVLSLFPTQQLNASLALQMAHAWMKRESTCDNESNSNIELEEAQVFSVSQEMSEGLLSCRWPGRNQVLASDCGRITYFIDGAHTHESMEACVEWFNHMSLNRPKKHRALLLNLTGDRDGTAIFRPLLSCNFDLIIFCPNIGTASTIRGDNNYLQCPANDQITRVHELSKLWDSMSKACADDLKLSSCATCVHDALAEVLACEGEWDILATGSLHLVGSLLSIIDPTLEKSEGYSVLPAKPIVGQNL